MISSCRRRHKGWAGAGGGIELRCTEDGADSDRRRRESDGGIGSQINLGDVSEIDAGVMAIELTPIETVSVIPCIASTVWVPISRVMV